MFTTRSFPGFRCLSACIFSLLLIPGSPLYAGSGHPASGAAARETAASRNLYEGNSPKEVPDKGKNPQDSTAVLLKEIIVSAGIKNVNTSPLRLQSVDQKQIATIAPGRTYPELLKNIPGIYATSETGSYGDAKINIRGFKQENISVLLNGLPISGLSSGNMFWNNWLGLTDATATIQVQKGIGGSMLSDNSVGGTINIITKSPVARPALDLGYYYTDYGTSKGFIGYNSGQLKKGWSISLMASYVWGQSWVECTDVRSMAYILSISKKINSRHSLLFTALGSPERHQQRSSRLTYDEMEQYGRDYSKNWGYYQGKTKNISRNTYFKPYFTLNHFYTGQSGLTVNNAIYLAIGNGGGIWTESKGKRIISYQKDGHIDWDAVVEDNRNSPDGASQNILSDYLAGHIQLGAKSSLNIELNQKWEMEAGLHYQYYSTWEKEKITDLLGGEYWYEDYQNNSLAGQAGRNSIKKIGDYIRTHNGKMLHYGTLYGMVRYRDAKWILEGGVSLNGSLHQRWDKYNYVTDTRSDVARASGASIKAGALYKISPRHSLYLNGAYYSRIPYSNVFFDSGNNSISRNVKNERNLLGEIGYRFVHSRGGVEATFYTAYWKNKSIMSDPYKPLEEDAYKFMITGLNALHYGIELQAYHNVANWMTISGYASVGSWKWKNNVSAKIYDPYTSQVAGEIHVYSDGLPIGDAPQTQTGLSAQLRPLKAFDILPASDFTIDAEWQYNARYWADFEPASRTDPQDSADPYRIPSYHLLNIGLNWSQRLSPRSLFGLPTGATLSLFLNLNNVTDSKYIERGKDGADHSRETFTGYWGIGRNVNFGVRLTL